MVTWNRGWLGERVVSGCVGGPAGASLVFGALRRVSFVL